MNDFAHTQSSSQSGSQYLSAPEKAAIIIALLGPEEARPIVEQIEDRHMRAFLNALENLRQIPREKTLAVVADFITELQSRRGSLRGGSERAREIAEGMLAEDRVTRLFGNPPPAPKAPTSAENVWKQLLSRTSDDIAAYLEQQRPIVISTVLTHMPSDRTGEILAELPEDLSVMTVKLMSRDTEPAQQAVDAVAELVNMEFLNVEQKDAGSAAAMFVADVMGILPRERRRKMLDTLEASDPEQAKRIRDNMLTFEDLKTRLPVSVIPRIFRDFDQTQLLRMLKVGPDQDAATVDFFYANISQRMADQYREQVEGLGPVSQKQGETAVSALMGFIRGLERQGLAKIKPRETADEAE